MALETGESIMKNIVKFMALMAGLACLTTVNVWNVFGETLPVVPIDKKIPAGKIEFKDIHVFTLENPIIGIQILPHDNLVPAGISGSMETNELRVIAAKGEYESASVVIHALKDISGLILETGDFQKENGGQIIPRDEIDVRAVKCWYQAGEAWTGSLVASKTIRKLTPELLLKNDGLVRVDENEEKNYMTLQFPEGKKEIWISDPANAKSYTVIYRPEEFPVCDGKLLQPLDLKAGANKQYWLTVRVPEDAGAGVYTTQIKVKSGKDELGKIALRLRVLPFSLPLPKTWYDSGKDFISSIYYHGVLNDSYPDGSVSSEYKSEEQLRAELRDMLAHNIFNPNCYQSFQGLGTYLKIRNELGIKGLPLYWLGGGIQNPQNEAGLEEVRKTVRQARAIAATYGIKNVYFYGIDEATGEKLVSQRKTWEAVHQAGGKMFVAGYTGNFEKVGDLLDLQVHAETPIRDEARKWHSVGHQIFCYSNPQCGPENPELFRRNYGLLLWKAEYDGAATYAYQHSFGNIWNDFDSDPAQFIRDRLIYRDHLFSHPTVDGVIPTLAIEGYREGIDDIRYGTLLRSLILENKGRRGTKSEIAKSAENYLETLDTKRDPGVIRLEIIDYILKLIGGKNHGNADHNAPTG